MAETAHRLCLPHTQGDVTFFFSGHGVEVVNDPGVGVETGSRDEGAENVTGVVGVAV